MEGTSPLSRTNTLISAKKNAEDRIHRIPLFREDIGSFLPFSCTGMEQLSEYTFLYAVPQIIHFSWNGGTPFLSARNSGLPCDPNHLLPVWKHPGLLCNYTNYFP